MRPPSRISAPPSRRPVVRLLSPLRSGRWRRPPRVATTSVNIAELKRKSVPELHEMAERLRHRESGGLRKQDLIFRIEQKLLDQNVALTGEGVLEILPEGYGFLRSQDWNYLYGPDDIYVSPSQIKRFDLRTGDTVSGQVRPPKEWERYLALLKVESVNGDEPEVAKARIAFDNLRPRYPDGRLRLETKDGDVSMRIMDLIAPIGKGQRGLIVVAAARRQDDPAPEDRQRDSRESSRGHAHRAADRRAARGSHRHDRQRRRRGDRSTFDEEATRHVQVADMVIEKAKRLVEHKKDVVILLDSITRLARAHNAVAPQSGKILSGGVDAKGLEKPKRFFGAARNIEGGGSLTIIATALIETGSRMDEVIFEEFKGTGNMELVLDRKIAERRIYPGDRHQQVGHAQGRAAVHAGRAQPRLPAAQLPRRHAGGGGDRVPAQADVALEEQQGVLPADGAGVDGRSDRS